LFKMAYKLELILQWSAEINRSKKKKKAIQAKLEINDSRNQK